jgi:hypothetical protein
LGRNKTTSSNGRGPRVPGRTVPRTELQPGLVHWFRRDGG